MLLERLYDISFKAWLFERYLRENENDLEARKIRDKYIEMLRELLKENEILGENQ